LAKFKDALDREWKIKIFRSDVGDLRQIGLDLNKMKTDSSVLEVFGDDEIFNKVFLHLCEQQMREKQIDEKSFLKGFDSDVSNLALRAFLEEFFLFSQSLPEKVGISINKKMNEMMDKQTEEMIAKIEYSGLKPSATSSPESSESIPQG